MLRSLLPYTVFKELFGDRRKYGLKLIKDDPDFIKWEKFYNEFYTTTQKKGIGRWVCHLGFKIMRSVDLTNKFVLEVGPGIVDHFEYNSTRPARYIIADVFDSFLDKSEEILKTKFNVTNVEKVKVTSIQIPLPDSCVDVVVTFHQLEHVYELDKYLVELKRVLKPGGVIVGAVPTEGGLAWGLGRLMTSNRFVNKNADFNYNKIICWEHPNFVDKIKRMLDKEFTKMQTVKRPFSFLPLDFNLSFSFCYRKES